MCKWLHLKYDRLDQVPISNDFYCQEARRGFQLFLDAQSYNNEDPELFYHLSK